MYFLYLKILLIIYLFFECIYIAVYTFPYIDISVYLSSPTLP